MSYPLTRIIGFFIGFYLVARAELHWRRGWTKDGEDNRITPDDSPTHYYGKIILYLGFGLLLMFGAIFHPDVVYDIFIEFLDA